MLRILTKISLIIFAVFLVWIIVFQVHFNMRGKALLVERLQALTGRKVTVGSFFATFPTNIHARNIEIEGLGKVDQIYAAGGFYNVFTKGFGFAMVGIYHPSLVMARGADQSFTEIIAPVVRLFVRRGPLGAGSSITPFTSCYIGHLVINDGNITYTDTVSAQKSIVIRLEDLSVNIDNMNFCALDSRVTNFMVKARIPWREGSENGTLTCNGWYDWFKKDMQASLKVENIDAVYLYPYYAKWLDPEKARIERARMQLTSDISGLNNDINAQCRLELTDIVFTPRAPEDENRREEKIAGTVLGMFKEQGQGDQGKVVLSFPIKTHMDDPKFGFGTIKSAVESKIHTEMAKNRPGIVDVVFFPAKIVEGGIRTTTDMTKAVIGGVFSIGWELLTPFKSQKPATAPQPAQQPKGDS